MLTIFSIPKPFRGHIGIIQRNAIQSWLRLDPSVQVVLCGNEEGTESIATQMGADFLADIARNEYGTPLVDSVFERVKRQAKQPMLCYINADIILLSDFLRAVQSLRLPEFLLVGQRWDISIETSLDFEQPNWEEQLRIQITSNAILHSPSGIDFFVFPCEGKFWRMPPFAVGRPGWDNWFIFNARRLRIPVIDATQAVTVVHQNHDYAHIPSQRGEYWEGPEADQNRALMGGPRYAFTISDTTHFLSPDTLRVIAKHYNFRAKVAESLRMYALAEFPNSRLYPLCRFLNAKFKWSLNHVPLSRALWNFVKSRLPPF